MLRQALYDNSDTLFKTIPYNGIYELREAIADYLHKNRGMTVSPSQVMIGAGTEYLYSRLIQLFGRKSTFGFEESSFTSSQQYVRPMVTHITSFLLMRADLLLMN